MIQILIGLALLAVLNLIALMMVMRNVEIIAHQIHHLPLLSSYMRIIMTQIDDLKAAVAQETTVEQSAIALLSSLSSQLQAAINGSNPTADVQAVIDTMNANQTALAAAVTANTPAASQPEPQPEAPPAA